MNLEQQISRLFSFKLRFNRILILFLALATFLTTPSLAHLKALENHSPVECNESDTEDSKSKETETHSGAENARLARQASLNNQLRRLAIVWIKYCEIMRQELDRGQITAIKHQIPALTLPARNRNLPLLI